MRDGVKRLRVKHFRTPAAHLLKPFTHYTKKKGQSATEYYDKKRHLGCLANLNEAHVASGLIDGLATEMEIIFMDGSLTHHHNRFLWIGALRIP